MTNDYFKNIVNKGEAIHATAKLFGRKDNQVAYILQKLAWVPSLATVKLFEATSGHMPKNQRLYRRAIRIVADDFRINSDKVMKIMCDFSCLPIKVQDNICTMVCTD